VRIWSTNYVLCITAPQNKTVASSSIIPYSVRDWYNPKVINDGNIDQIYEKKKIFALIDEHTRERAVNKNISRNMTTRINKFFGLWTGRYLRKRQP
jgi:hypothetical protein